MDVSPTGYLVVRRPDGFGEAHPLHPTRRYTLGRAAQCEIVLKDDLCSRKHAVVAFEDDAWQVIDLGSLNGSYVNDTRVQSRHILDSGDEFRLGRSVFLFVRTLGDLPSLPDSNTTRYDETDSMSIVRRADQSRFLPPPPVANETTQGMPVLPNTHARVSTSEAVAVLFRLAIDMAQASDAEHLAELALAAIFHVTPADTAAVLIRNEEGEANPITTQVRGTGVYHKPTLTLLREVDASRQAILAEEPVSEGSDPKVPNKLASLICAPLLVQDQLLGYLHLMCGPRSGRLNSDDLEFAVGVARQLGVVWQHVTEKVGLAAENQVLRDQLRLESELVGSSPALKQIEEQVVRVAGAKATVLIRGESGVGKELVARAIHATSPRKDRPFVTLNCAALTETLLERELFGHEKGAFTGANERVIGKFEAADHGSIFLDEIGEMSPSTQAKLLRVLEGQPFERLGGNVPIIVNVRVIAATNRPLEEAVRENRFRSDLYFRLQVVQIDVPPLRKRLEDVPILANHFLQRFARETGRKIRGFTPAALQRLTKYAWPGNIRELRNVIERAVALSSSPVLDESDIWLSPLTTTPAPAAATSYEPLSLNDLEKLHIQRTLEHTGWNKSRAAEILGIERSTLDRKIKTYGLSRT